MTDEQLRRAVNATLMPGFAGPVLPGWLADELADGLGSVCLFATNIVDADQLRALTRAIHAANPAALIATDEEGGDVTRLHAREGSPHPSPAYLGRLDDPARTEQVGAGIGAELRAAGIDLNLAPVADVNSNPDNPVIGVRSFGADAHLAARHVAAYTAGLQAEGVAAVAKHFPGHGDTASDSHRELPTVTADAKTLAERELVPFVAAVAAGTLAVMTSHILVPAIDPELPATFSSPVLAVLRDEIGFSGTIVSDALDMAGASAGRGVAEAAVLALAAGVDLLCIGTDTTAGQLAAIRAHVLDAVRSGRLPRHRVADAAARVGALSSRVAEMRATAAAELRPVVLTGDGFRVAGPLVAMTAPVLVRLESPDNVAAGSTVWGIGEHLRAELDEALPGASCVTVGDLSALDALLDATPRRPLVVMGRDLARVPFLRAASQRVRDRRADAVLVDLGWPSTACPADVETFGSGRGTMIALIRLLAAGR